MSNIDGSTDGSSGKTDLCSALCTSSSEYFTFHDDAVVFKVALAELQWNNSDMACYSNVIGVFLQTNTMELKPARSFISRCLI